MALSSLDIHIFPHGIVLIRNYMKADSYPYTVSVAESTKYSHEMCLVLTKEGSFHIAAELPRIQIQTFVNNNKIGPICRAI